MRETRIVTVPAAAVSFAPVVPPADIEMLGMVAHLVALDHLHPSLVDRLVEAAREVHSAGDALAPAQRFPAADGGALPVDPYARTLIEKGSSSLQEVLP